MASPKYLILRVAACLSAALLLAGCGSSDERAREALSAYQAASAANDVIGARSALLELVKAKDDVPDYWVELGKLEATMGSYNDANYAFTRAYELDRNNVDILRAVTELALRSGDAAMAQAHAHELEILSPGDPWVKLTKGWSAFSESHFDEALETADDILRNAPFDTAGTVLKARSLMSLDRDDEAEDLLTKHIQAQPSDLTSEQVLAKIYVKRNDWVKSEAVAKRMNEVTPKDPANALLLIESAFRSGDVGTARQTSLNLLRSQTDPSTIRSALELWTNYWPSTQRIQDARTLGAAAVGLQQKLIYASFLNRAGSPTDAVRLSSEAAGLPITARNAEANAVLADGWWRIGQKAQAKSRFDAVIAFDPGNATALRGRAELELRSGDTSAAIVDAQKLVTVLPNSAPSRLLLAQSYAASGSSEWMERTLWSAFQDIPADERIFAALQNVKRGNPEATKDLQEEFDRQRNAKLNRGLL